MRRTELRTLSVVCLALLLVGGLFAAEDDAVYVSASAEEVGRYQTIEFRIACEGSYDDATDPAVVEVSLLVSTPTGPERVVPAFFAQDYEILRADSGGRDRPETSFYPVGQPRWKARYAPLELGRHRARVRVRDRQGERFSQPVAFECHESRSRGFLRVGASDPRFFEFDNGQFFFVMGQNIAFVGESQYMNLAKLDATFAKLAANGANFVRVWTCCQDWALCLEGRKSAWGRSWSGTAPLVPRPGDAEGRQCLRLEAASRPLECSPTRAVFLRPNVRYVLRGRFWAEADGGLEVEMGHGVGRVQFTASGAGEWTSFQQPFVTGPGVPLLGRLSFSAGGSGDVYLEGLSLTEAGGGPELLGDADVNRPARGVYHQVDSAMLDEVVRSAERHGIVLMLCLVNRDLYMNALSEVGSAEYERATADAKKFLRYCAARWGASTAVGAWEFFNEMDPGKPTDAFYAELGLYLDAVDVYRHLRTTSTWHPSARDIRLESLDIGQLHHYMRPGVEGEYRDEVAVVVERTRMLRENGPAKPVLLGEFGLATPQWGLNDAMKTDSRGVHFRRSLWASTFAGGSGTAMFWWWEELDRQEAYGHYRPLASFLEGVSFAGLRPTTAQVEEPMRVMGWQGEERAYLWLNDARATWHAQVIEGRPPAEVSACTLTLSGLAAGVYRITWWDTRVGKVSGSRTVGSEDGVLRVTAPVVSGDVACKIERP